MNRLFVIHDRDGKAVESLGLKGSYVNFTNKPFAKRLRDELNSVNPGHVVSRGPDHWKEQVVPWSI